MPGQARQDEFRWIVSQIGARQHYGVPRGFLYKSDLRVLYTEAWCHWGRSLFSRGSKQFRAFATRCHEDIPNRLVVSFNWHVILQALQRRPATLTTEQEYRQYIETGKWFATRVARHLKMRRLEPEKDVFLGFNTGSFETIQLMNERGIPNVLDQIDPAAVEEQIVYEETLKWPGWQKAAGRIPDFYWQRMRDEWSAANMILVNSQWSKDALIKQGVPAEKMFIVPVAYEAARTHLPSRKNMDGPLTVLWIGSVNLRKGIQYLIQAAKLLLTNPRIRFLIAGPIYISDQALATAPANMQFIGKVNRDQTEEMYRRADVFVLPTISDGFAITQVEAMAQGLPVITTPNCGEVVTPEVDGLIVPASDAQSLAGAIARLDENRLLLREMSYRALDKSAHFYLPRQAQLVEEAVINYRAGRPWDRSKYKI